MAVVPPQQPPPQPPQQAPAAAPPAPAPPPSPFMRFFTSPMTWSAILLVGLLAFIGWILWSGTRPIVDQLPDLEFARGIITLIFVLFTIGFAAIVLIHGLFFSNETEEDRQFTRGREVLGLFIGIVGTIVGFYFGSAEKGAAKIDMALHAELDATTRKVAIHAHATGGTPPYQFVVSVGDTKQSTKLKGSPFKSDDGWLSIPAAESLEGSEV